MLQKQTLPLHLLLPSRKASSILAKSAFAPSELPPELPLELLSKMSDKREAQDKPLIIVRNAEDYTTWKPYTISRLQQQNCNWVIVGRPQPNLESV